MGSGSSAPTLETAHLSGGSEETLALRTRWSAIATATGTLGQVLTSIATARILGLDRSGELGFLLWTSATVATVTGLGIAPTLTRFVAQLRGAGRAADAEAAAAWLLRRAYAAALVGTAAVCVIAAVRGEWARAPLAWALLAVQFATQQAMELEKALLGGREEFQRFALLMAGAAAAQVAGVTAGSAFGGVAGAVAGYAAGSAPFLVHAALDARRATAEIGTDLRARIREFLVPTYLAIVVSLFAWSRMEVFFLERSLGDRAVSIFSVALSFSNLVSQWPLVLTGALLPHMSARLGSDDLSAVRRAYTTATRLLAILVLPCCAGAMAVAPVLVPLLYGREFAVAVPTTMILLLFAGAGTVAAAGSALQYASGGAGFIFRCGLAGAAIIVVAGLTIVPRAGPEGAAAARSLVQVGMVSLGAWYVRRVLDAPVPLGALGRIAAAAVACGLGAGAIVQAIGGPHSLAVAIPAGVAVYLASLRALRAVGAEDAAAIERVAAGLPVPLLALLRRTLQLVRRA